MQYRSVGFVSRLRDSFWRHRWVFLISVLTVSGITAGALAMRKPQYHASAAAQVVAEEDDLGLTAGNAERFTFASPSQQQVNHLSDLLSDDRPDGFLDTALKHAQLPHPINIDPRVQDKRAIALRKALSVTADSTSLFSISLTWEDPEECERILQSFMAQYIEEVGDDKQAKSIATTKFLDSQIAEYLGNMRKAEQTLIEFKQNNTGQLPDAQNADIQQASALKIQRDNMLVELHDNEMKKAAIEKRMHELPAMSLLERTVGESAEQATLREMQRQRAVRLGQGFQPTSDVVKDLDTRIENLTKLVQAESIAVAKHGPDSVNVVSMKQQNNPEYITLSQQLSDATIGEKTQTEHLKVLDTQIAEYDARIQKIPQAQRELTDKTRDYTFWKGEYERLIAQRSQAKMKSDLDKITATTGLTPVGTIYATPTTPRSKQILMFAGSVILGLIVGVVIVILSEWGDTTLRYASDAERALDIPVLAEVPELKVLAPAQSRGGMPSGDRGTLLDA